MKSQNNINQERSTSHEYDKTRISKEKHKDEDIAYTYNEVGKISTRSKKKARNS